MAQGSLTKFEATVGYIAEQVVNIATGSFKVALLSVGVDVILASEATPKLGSGNLTECSAGGGYDAGGFAITLDNSNSGGTYKMKLDTTPHTDGKLTFTAAAGSPETIKTACLYLASGGALEALCVWDITTDGGTTPASLIADDVVLHFTTGPGEILDLI